MNHTPGPWRYCDGGIFADGPTIEDDNIAVAQVYGCGMNGPRTEAGLANARLIAKAPELLAALKRRLEQDDESGYGDYPWPVEDRHLIASIEGEL